MLASPSWSKVRAPAAKQKTKSLLDSDICLFDCTLHNPAWLRVSSLVPPRPACSHRHVPCHTRCLHDPRHRFARVREVTKPGPFTKHVLTPPAEQGSHLEGNHLAARGDIGRHALQRLHIYPTCLSRQVRFAGQVGISAGFTGNQMPHVCHGGGCATRGPKYQNGEDAARLAIYQPYVAAYQTITYLCCLH